MSASQSVVRQGHKIAEHSVAWHTFMEQEATDAAWQQLPFTAITRLDGVLCEWRMCRVCGQYLRRTLTSVSAAYAPRAAQSQREANKRRQRIRRRSR